MHVGRFCVCGADHTVSPLITQQEAARRIFGNLPFSQGPSGACCGIIACGRDLSMIEMIGASSELCPTNHPDFLA